MILDIADFVAKEITSSSCLLPRKGSWENAISWEKMTICDPQKRTSE